VRSLRFHNSLRTNHFEVQNRLDGLEERFRINHRDGLADALRERLDDLARISSKWHPEILHLLLELSDQPTQKSVLEDLDDLIEPEPEAPTPLKWASIAKEDGWKNDPDLWKTPDFSEGSEDELYQDADSVSSVDNISASGADLERKLQAVIVEPHDHAKRNKIRETQEWRWAGKASDPNRRTHKKALSTLQVCREVLFMLNGLSTDLFPQVGVANPNYQMSGVQWETYKALITSFAEMGRRLGVLRDFSKLTLHSAPVQVFQDCVTRSLDEFGRQVTGIESRLIDPQEDVVVSLPAVQEEVRGLAEPLYCVSDIISKLQESSNQGPFYHLELLFDQIGISQGTGKPEVYKFLGRIFFDCFQLYLRPIRLWMAEGELVPGDKIFFVSELSTPVALNDVWQKQYRLRRSQDGSLHAPKFLHPAANKIFTAGKGVVVLKHLGKYEGASDASSLVDESAFDFDSISATADLDFAPFGELFETAFDRWVETKHKPVSTTLKNALFDSCGLWTALNATECLYFMSDGALADTFCSALFKKLDCLNQGWRDRYALSALAQEIYSTKVDPHRLSVVIGAEGQRLPATTARDFVRKCLPEISLAYNLRWPVQMILTRESLERYKIVFTFHLQLRRAHHMLHKRRLLANDATDGENWPERSAYYCVRSKLLWFCNTFRTYLTSLVLAPNWDALRSDLKAAQDVDAMIDIHTAFTKRVVHEGCLGSKLQPILECVLDILDLTISLEKAHALAAAREAEEMQELSRLSVMSSPPKSPPKRKGLPDDSDNDEDGEDLSSFAEVRARSNETSFGVTLRDINAAYEKHLKFVTDGLRSVARATGDAAAMKWDILAQMLEAGYKSGKFHEWS